MTATSLPSTPPMPSMPPNDPSQAAKKSRTNLVIIGSAAAVIAAIVGTGVVVVESRTDESKPVATAKPKAQDEDTVTAAKPEAEPTYSEVDADSFTMALKITSRQCFGSAGCNVKVEPDLTILGDGEGIDPDAVYDVTYEIHGDESGPVIATAELSDRRSLNCTPSMISTASAGTKVSVEITEVSVQGG
ncbi:hypothetical protein [Streptomyces prunicolor]